MAEKVENHDFVSLDYTGKLVDGTIFDTTDKEVAKSKGIPKDSVRGSIIICVGEKQILPGLDDKLIGQEIGKKLIFHLKPEESFGKKDVKKIKIVPISAFKEQKVAPQPGLQVDIDGKRGTITRVTGGRIMVNFNHPLAGRDVEYEVTIHKKVTDVKDQVASYFATTLGLKEDKFKVEVNDNVAIVKLPFELPDPVKDLVSKKLVELTKSKEIKIEKL